MKGEQDEEIYGHSTNYWGLEAPDEEAARKIVVDYLKVSMKPQDLQADMVDYQKINCFPN